MSSFALVFFYSRGFLSRYFFPMCFIVRYLAHGKLLQKPGKIIEIKSLITEKFVTYQITDPKNMKVGNSLLYRHSSSPTQWTIFGGILQIFYHSTDVYIYIYI